VVKVILLLLFSFEVFSQSADKNTLKEISMRCNPLKPSAQLYADEFKWGYGLPELVSKFFEIYNSNKRLPSKAYWDHFQNKLLLPIRSEWGGPVEITESFVQSVARHIERAFELQVIDGVFFPDMGHSHLLIPEQHYNSNYHQFEVTEFSKKYKKLFEDPKVEILYHTAEQLRTRNESGQLLPDPRLQFRHKTRNPVGQNRPNSDLKFLENNESPANTAGAPQGYVWWSGGFNLSAHHEGCFAYTNHGQTYFFDISLFDLEYDPAHGGVFSNF